MRDYTWGLFTLQGSVGARYEENRYEINGQEDRTQTLGTEVSLGGRAFVWDPRFLTVRWGVGLGTSSSGSDSGRDTTTHSIGYSLNAVLFPRWRYPYRPFRFQLSHGTYGTDGSNSTDTVSTTFSARWGLVHRLFGGVGFNYELGSTEKDRGESEEDSLRHVFSVDADKTFREGQWGESKVNYGYAFNYDENDNSEFIQNRFFVRDSTQLGEKSKFRGGGTLFFRSNNSGAGGDFNTNFLSVNGRLSFTPTQNFSHGYSLASSRADSNGSTNSSYTGSANANYLHKFSRQLTGHISGGANAGLFLNDESETRTNMALRGSGGVSYRKSFIGHAIGANYGGSLSQSFGEDDSELSASQNINLSYRRLGSSLYSDRFRLSVRNQLLPEFSYTLSANYTVNSGITESDTIRTSAGYNLTDGDGDGAASSSYNVTAVWSRVFSGTGNTHLTLGHVVSEGNNSERIRDFINWRLRTRLFSRRSLAVVTNVRWEHSSSERADQEDEDSSKISATARLDYAIGLITTSLSYRLEVEESEDFDRVDNELLIRVKRSFRGIRF